MGHINLRRHIHEPLACDIPANVGYEIPIIEQVVIQQTKWAFESVSLK